MRTSQLYTLSRFQKRSAKDDFANWDGGARIPGAVPSEHSEPAEMSAFLTTC